MGIQELIDEDEQFLENVSNIPGDQRADVIWDARLLSEGMSKKGKQDVTILLSQLPQEKRKDFVELICKSSQGMDEDDKLSLIIIEGTENKHELIPLLRSMDLYYKFETIELMQEDFVQDAITRINLRIIPINDY